MRSAAKILVLSVAALSLSLAAACDKEGAATTADGGKPVKRACKMEGKCYLCPDDEAMKKCILNPGTSGCKATSDSDCEISK